MKLDELVKAEGAIGALLAAQVDDGKMAIKIRRIATSFKRELEDYHELYNGKIKELAGGKLAIKIDDPAMVQFTVWLDGLLADDSFNPPPQKLTEDEVALIKVPRSDSKVSALSPGEIDGLYALGIIKDDSPSAS